MQAPLAGDSQTWQRGNTGVPTQKLRSAVNLQFHYRGFYAAAVRYFYEMAREVTWPADFPPSAEVSF